MGLEIFVFGVVILILFAIFDLMVGVSNDAVNFLNSSIGSKVAPRTIIMIIASLGILAGVTFSSGMMEVARKGIFHPGLFTMPNLMVIFLAVMLTDIVLLDLFNTFGLPTSTTVSIVFELLGAAVAVSIVKLVSMSGSIAGLSQYINTAKAMMIIGGILLSVAVSFLLGSLAQFLTRLIFTFDYLSRIKRYGALWGGIAMASIIYFILVKGAKGASFITPEVAASIKQNKWIILSAVFAASAVIFQVLLFLRMNILKPIILIGTFALAMAFAANDLVNFIGVPLAGLNAFQLAASTSDPLNVLMTGLAKKVPTQTGFLLLAGMIMVVTLWISKKARTVTETEVSLGQQHEGHERFESVLLSRVLVRMWISLYNTVAAIVPGPVKTFVASRFDQSHFENTKQDDGIRFDLIRASVNLMVASAVISYATSYKLPLSTTYVTFMVAMGTSFADRAWGRESAVYRITGVLTVIGGWFMTALSAFLISGTVAALLFLTKLYVVPLLLALIALIIWKNHHKHTARAAQMQRDKIFNLKKITDPGDSIEKTFEHMGHLIQEMREVLGETLEGLFWQDSGRLRQQAKRVKNIQKWSNILVANIFKTLRLLQRGDLEISKQYSYSNRQLQRMSDCVRDIVTRARMHVDNHHKGLLEIQKKELGEIKGKILDILQDVESAFKKHKVVDYNAVRAKDEELIETAARFNNNQIQRIADDTSKTRLSILFYAVIEDAKALSKQNLKLMETFQHSLSMSD